VAQLLLDHTPPEAVLQQRLLFRAPLDAAHLAHAGPVTLVGDALHCMVPSLGQGACGALEGALELATWLSSAARERCRGTADQPATLLSTVGSKAVTAARERRPGTAGLVAALRGYEATRLARAGIIQRRSADAGVSAYRRTSDKAAANGPTGEHKPQAGAAAAATDADFVAWLYGYAPPVLA
jgi:2-polyprenyl-6-methoxyphenol hydroxylase-like FAD-dependent oxidoreductase